MVHINNHKNTIVNYYYQDCVLLTADAADVSKNFLNESASGSLSVNRKKLGSHTYT